MKYIHTFANNEKNHDLKSTIIQRVFSTGLFVFFVALISSHTQAKDHASETSQEIQRASPSWQTILKLKDDDFFTLDKKALSSRKKDLLFSSVTGIAINTPKIIHTQKQNSIPGIIASKITGLQNWSTPLPDNTYVMATNHSSGNMYIQSVFISEKARRRYQPATPNELTKPQKEDADSYGVTIDLVDLREIFNIPWHDGEWTFRALYFDSTSDPVSVKIESKNNTDRKDQKDNIKEKERITIPLTHTKKSEIKNCTDKLKQNISSTYQEKDEANGILKNSLIISGTIPSAESAQVKPATLLLLKKNDARAKTLELNFLAEETSSMKNTNPDSAQYSRFSFNFLALKNITSLTKGEYVAFLSTGNELIGPASFSVSNED